MRFFVLLTLISGVMGLVSLPAAAGFVQDRFAIGFWVPPPTDAKTDQRYKEIADANFTLVIGGFGTQAKKVLDVCHKYGLKALVDPVPNTPASAYPNGDACWGYLIADEPGPAAFPGLRATIDDIRRSRPGRFGYVNLYPNYCPLWALGTPDYDSHVAKYMREVHPDVLSMDHYPIMKPNADSRDAYCQNLETMRKYSVKAGVPFWNFFHSMPFGDRWDPTEAQIRWQINAAVAYGAKGVLYFCYYTPGPGGEFPKGGAIIARDDRKTRHWDEARRINAELKNMGPTLMQLTCTGAYRVGPKDDAAKVLAGSPLKSIAPVDDEANDFLVGAFTHKDGRRAAYLVNWRHDYTAWHTVEFDCDPAQVMEVDKETGG